MSRPHNLIIAALSLVPSIVLVLMFLFEPLLYGMGWDRRLVSETGQLIRLVSAILVIVMIYYFASYTYRSGDPRLEGKKSLWITLLLLGNIFAVPAFWYLFFRHPGAAQTVSRS